MKTGGAATAFSMEVCLYKRSQLFLFELIAQVHDVIEAHACAQASRVTGNGRDHARFGRASAASENDVAALSQKTALMRGSDLGFLYLRASKS